MSALTGASKRPAASPAPRPGAPWPDSYLHPERWRLLRLARPGADQLIAYAAPTEHLPTACVVHKGLSTLHRRGTGRRLTGWMQFNAACSSGGSGSSGSSAPAAARGDQLACVPTSSPKNRGEPAIATMVVLAVLVPALGEARGWQGSGRAMSMMALQHMWARLAPVCHVGLLVRALTSLALPAPAGHRCTAAKRHTLDWLAGHCEATPLRYVPGSVPIAFTGALYGTQRIAQVIRAVSREGCSCGGSAVEGASTMCPLDATTHGQAQRAQQRRRERYDEHKRERMAEGKQCLAWGEGTTCSGGPQSGTTGGGLKALRRKGWHTTTPARCSSTF